MDESEAMQISKAKELVLRTQAGDNEAFGELYALYRDSIYYYLWRRIDNYSVIEDLISDIFIKALRNIGNFEWHDDRDSLGAWLFTIARNRFLDHCKSHKERNEVFDPQLHDMLILSDTEHILTQMAIRQMILPLLKLLTPQQRQCLTLRFFEGLNVEETAQTMGIRPAAVRSHQFKAIAKLRPRVTREGLGI